MVYFVVAVDAVVEFAEIGSNTKMAVGPLKYQYADEVTWTSCFLAVVDTFAANHVPLIELPWMLIVVLDRKIEQVVRRMLYFLTQLVVCVDLPEFRTCQETLPQSGSSYAACCE